MRYTEIVREFIRSEMQDQGMTLGELSRRTGIDKGNLSKYLNSKRGISENGLDTVMAVVTEDIGPISILYDHPGSGRTCSRPGPEAA